MNNIFDLIRKERERQDEKWGIQSHQPIVWSAILQEETGEVAKAALEELFDTSDVNIEDYKEELIQTAAVCVAALQCLEEGYADSHSHLAYFAKNHKEWIPLDWNSEDSKNWLEAETGDEVEVLTTTGNTYVGYQMDWGFVPNDSEDESTLEEMGEKIVFFRYTN